MRITADSCFGAVMTFVFCIFMGITAVAIGLGAAFPPLNLIAKPFVCPAGQMTYQTTTSKPLPGTTYTQIGWYCVDIKAGKSTELGVLQIVPFSGTIYGLLIFAVVAVIYLLRSILRSSAAAIRVQAAPYVPSTAQPAGPAFSAGAAEGAQERLNELKRLRASDLITEAEYQAKRAEILKDI